MGFPIRKSADQRLFAPPHGLSQRTTSFIASQRQGIHRIPLLHLIALIIDVRHALSPRQRTKRQSTIPSRKQWTGLDLKTSFASNTSGNGGQARSLLAMLAARQDKQGRSLVFPDRNDRICSLFTMSDICAHGSKTSAKLFEGRGPKKAAGR